MQFRCLLIVAFVQLSAVRCYAVLSTNLTLRACDYASENLYVVNASNIQTGYTECANATGTGAELCKVCSCREKKVASVAGVTVAWVVCVGNATTCSNNDGSGQEYCGSRSTSYSQDSSSSGEGFNVNVGDSSSSTSSEVGIADGSDASADTSSSYGSSSTEDGITNGSDASIISSSGSATSANSPSIDSSGSVDTSVDVGSSSSCGTISESVSDSVGSNSGESPVSTPSATRVESSTLSSKGSESQATNEDNAITGTASTVQPSQSSEATSTEQNIIRPSDNGSTHQLDTNNGSSTNSSWSGTRLTAVLTVMCGIAGVAAIAVFVAVRRDQAKKKKALGTPVEEYTDDDSSLATPMTRRLDGKYHHGRRYGGNGLPSDNTPLASIVVIGPDDDFHTPTAYASGHRYRSYDRKLSDGYARTESSKASDSQVRSDNSHQNAVPAARQQFNVSHGLSASDMPSPAHDPIFDTNNTQVSFSSSMSSEYESAPPPSEPSYESQGRLTDSFRMVSETYSEGSLRDSDISTEPRKRETSFAMEQEQDASVRVTSSLSSLNSAAYDIRDTEASEHMHPSELGTNSSRIAMSFDLGSVSWTGHQHQCLENKI